MDIMRLLFGMDPGPSCVIACCFGFVCGHPLEGRDCAGEGVHCALEMTSPPASICLLHAGRLVRLVPTDDTCSKLTDHSNTCEAFAEETCALNAHETRTIVHCAKHHLPVPCSTCLENEKAIKKAVDEKKKEAEAQQTKTEKDGAATK